jgi:membrane protease YdiL (CAAX protease family)
VSEEAEVGGRRAPLQDDVATRLRGFGPLGIVSILIVLGGNFIFAPLSAVFALVWAWISRTPWRDLGFVRPRSWLRTIAAGILLGAALKLAMKSIVMPLLGAPPVNGALHFLAHNRAEIPWMLYTVLIVAGIGEEIVFRSWAFERLGKLLGAAPWAKGVAVIVTSAWFGWAHYGFQGMPGVQNATVVGLVFGTVFAATRRIYLLMIAHIAFDLVAYAIIYWEYETAVARFFFH